MIARGCEGMVDVFISYARSHVGADQLIDDLIEDAFINSPANSTNAVEDQTMLADAFREAVDAWARRMSKGYGSPARPLDPRQVVRAHFVAAWRYLQDLSDEDYDAAMDDLADEIATLRSLCDPDDLLLNDEPDA
jgi:hypothetical protein